MKDRYDRTIDYLRISITDRCNLRCIYCMPNGADWVEMKEILTYEEILDVVREATKCGIRKIKITGGEPLVRKGCAELIGQLKQIPGIEEVTMTTNGILLPRYLDELIENGIDAINVSIDTLNPQLYAKLTGKDCLQEVLDALYQASERGVRCKVNAVSLNTQAIAKKYGIELEENEWKNLIEIARNHPIDVRFIEVMPIGFGKKYSTINHEEFLTELRHTYPSLQKDDTIHGNGPAIYYKPQGFKGSVGLISAIHGKFCDSCNRIRLTSTGQLKTCLCFQSDIDLKEPLRNGQLAQVESIIREAIYNKPRAHEFEKEEAISEVKGMSDIGG